jgi:hypothetical protein
MLGDGDDQDIHGNVPLFRFVNPHRSATWARGSQVAWVIAECRTCREPLNTVGPEIVSMGGVCFWTPLPVADGQRITVDLCVS